MRHIRHRSLRQGHSGVSHPTLPTRNMTFSGTSPGCHILNHSFRAYNDHPHHEHHPPRYYSLEPSIPWRTFVQREQVKRYNILEEIPYSSVVIPTENSTSPHAASPRQNSSLRGPRHHVLVSKLVLQSANNPWLGTARWHCINLFWNNHPIILRLQNSTQSEFMIHSGETRPGYSIRFCSPKGFSHWQRIVHSILYVNIVLRLPDFKVQWTNF